MLIKLQLNITFVLTERITLLVRSVSQDASFAFKQNVNYDLLNDQLTTMIIKEYPESELTGKIIGCAIKFEQF